MFSPAKLSLKISRENEYKAVLHWESSTRICTTITSKRAAGTLTYLEVPEHNIPPGWRVRIGGIYYLVVSIYHDVIVISTTRTITESTLEYNAPVDLSKYTLDLRVNGNPPSSAYANYTDSTIVLEFICPVTAGQYSYTLVAYDESLEGLTLVDGTVTLEE